MDTSADRKAELLARAQAGSSSPGVNLGSWPGLEFLRADQPMRRSAANYEPALCVVAQGRKVAWLDEGHSIHYDPMHFLVVALPMPIDAEILEASPESPFLAVRIRIDAALLAEVLAALDDEAADSGPAPALASTPICGPILDTVVRLLRVCDDELERRVLLEPLQREMLFRLATGPQAPMLRQIVLRDHQGHRVVRAIRHVEGHFAETLSIADLANVARMGESTFHRAFRDVTGTTPLRYLKRFRLHHARNLMLNEDLTAAQAGAEVGYESPSQFSRDFKALFGETPRRAVDLVRGVALQPRSRPE